MNPSKRVVAIEGEAFLKFTVCEEDAEEYEDEYQLEDFSLAISDYMNPYELTEPGSFQKEWLALKVEEQ